MLSSIISGARKTVHVEKSTVTRKKTIAVSRTLLHKNTKISAETALVDEN